ncbi:MAG: hypothetical protein HZA46_21470 [Planctomycetales bacterium]|nr:hypothetical protein [Planctomycetales bacterium]
MKRWLVSSFIAVYLGALGFGLACHTLGSYTGSHPLMYFVVWDMFCGWASFATESHIVGEGESGKYYELSPGPWGDVKAWGTLDRHNFDAFNNHTCSIAHNTLRHTQHEPITRILVLEEHWSKKYDMPDHLWRTRFDEPKPAEIPKYSYLRAEYGPNGEIIRNHVPWLSNQFSRVMADNPRLAADQRRGKPLFVLDAFQGTNPSNFRPVAVFIPDDGKSRANSPSTN